MMKTKVSESVDLVVLCGGQGTRLRPLTERVPKALVEVNGRPIVDYILDFYEAAEFSSAILCVGYKGKLIATHLGERTGNVEYQILDQGEEASMLARIVNAQRHSEKRLLVCYCDTFIDLDLDEFLDCHMDSGKLATIVTAQIENPFGIVQLGEAGNVLSFREKPTFDYYIGSFLIEPSAFDLVSSENLAMPEGAGLVHLFEQLADRGELQAFSHRGLNISFNTESELLDAERELKSFHTLAENLEVQSP